jgi:hypothetical protein
MELLRNSKVRLAVQSGENILTSTTGQEGEKIDQEAGTRAQEYL